MGSPRRSRSSSLHRIEEKNNSSNMRFGSIAMDEPCLVASPSSKCNSNSNSNLKNAVATATAAATSPNQGTEDETKTNNATATILSSPNEASSSTSYTSAFGSSQQHQHSPKKAAKSPLHAGLGTSSDKTPYRSAASSSSSSSNRTQRKPFFLSRVLSSSVGSKQRWKETKLLRHIESRQQPQQRPSATEGRHPEESGSNPQLVGEDSVISPASTVHSSKSIPNGSNSKRRSRKPSIKFLKRALSSPPILLHRFHSNPIEKECLDTSEKIWQARTINNNNNNAPLRLPHVGSSSSSNSRSSVDLNSDRTNIKNTKAITVVPTSFSPTSTRSSFQRKVVNRRTLHADEAIESAAVDKAHCTSTSILHHTYLPVLETLCGVPRLDTLRDNNINTNNSSKKNMKFILPTADRQNTYDIRNEYYTQHPNNNNDGSRSHRQLPEDPTVQESIECIFASQLEDGLTLWDEEYDDDRNDAKCSNSGSGNHVEDDILGHRSFETLEQVRTSSRDGLLVSPSVVQQSRMNRKDRKDSSNSLFANMLQTKKRYEQASLVYVGTFDPSTPKNSVPDASSTNSNQSISNNPNDTSLDASTVYSNLPADPLPCSCATSFLPSVEPKDWPQAPLACRPTPGRGTKIKAIRFSNSTMNSGQPLWVPGSHLTWSQRLEQHWRNETEQEQRRKRDQQPHYACCEKCVLLPINNGNEAPGESLVVDFESELFEGSFLLRLRHSEGTTPEPYDDSTGYFTGMNRRYQACVRGRFKKVLPFTELKTGFRLDRKFGKLPSKWVLKGALKVVTFFAPQLEIKLEGVTKPYSITPLGSSPQCINVDDVNANENEHNKPKELSGCSDDESQPGHDTIEHSDAQMNLFEGIRVESSEAHRSLLGIGAKAKATTSLQRAKMRKKAFDKLYAQKAQEPKTDLSKIYTFEFLQHMMNFQEFSIDLGNMMGSLKLEEMLNGQPLPIMACHGDQYLWSFDVWNECLWKQAKKHDTIERQ